MVDLELIASIPDVVVRIVAIVLIAVIVRWLVGLALPLTLILASAGLGGIAVGFGARSPVKDFIAPDNRTPTS